MVRGVDVEGGWHSWLALLGGIMLAVRTVSVSCVLLTDVRLLPERACTAPRANREHTRLHARMPCAARLPGPDPAPRLERICKARGISWTAKVVYGGAAAAAVASEASEDRKSVV